MKPAVSLTYLLLSAYLKGSISVPNRAYFLSVLFLSILLAFSEEASLKSKKRLPLLESALKFSCFYAWLPTLNLYPLLILKLGWGLMLMLNPSVRANGEDATKVFDVVASSISRNER